MAAVVLNAVPIGLALPTNQQAMDVDSKYSSEQIGVGPASNSPAASLTPNLVGIPVPSQPVDTCRYLTPPAIPPGAPFSHFQPQESIAPLLADTPAAPPRVAPVRVAPPKVGQEQRSRFGWLTAAAVLLASVFVSVVIYRRVRRGRPQQKAVEQFRPVDSCPPSVPPSSCHRCGRSLQRVPIRAEEVLAVWNRSDQGTLNPDLLVLVKGLGSRRKRLIVDRAISGKPIELTMCPRCGVDVTRGYEIRGR
jgi:hypothetical protein